MINGDYITNYLNQKNYRVKDNTINNYNGTTGSKKDSGMQTRPYDHIKNGKFWLIPVFL